MYQGKTATQVYEEAKKIHNGSKTKMIEYPTENYEEGYDPESYTPPACNPLNCDDPQLFADLSRALYENEDPAHENITSILKDISNLNTPDPKYLLSQYFLLVKVSGTDWSTIKRTLIESAQFSYSSFISCIKGMIMVYQLQHAKTVNLSISTLGEATDNLKVATKSLKHQATMDSTFNRDLTKQLNALTTSLAQVMEKLDQKTLDASHPQCRGAQRGPSHTPTADSSSLPQENIPDKLRILPNTIFISRLLKVSFNLNGDPTISPITAEAKELLKLVQLGLSTSTLVCLLNQDHNKILQQLAKDQTIVSRFLGTNVREERLKILQSAFSEIPTLNNQWTRK